MYIVMNTLNNSNVHTKPLQHLRIGMNPTTISAQCIMVAIDNRFPRWRNSDRGNFEKKIFYSCACCYRL